MSTLSETRMHIAVSPRLILRLKDGDELAFRAIYDQLHSRIYRMLFSLVKDCGQTEELVQETFVSLWLHRKKLNVSQSLYPYIYLTAKRLAIDHFRKKMTETEAWVYLKNHLEKDTNNTEEAVHAADLYEFVEKVVKTLPKQQQRVFILSREKGWSCDEIAEHMHLSRHTVKNHLACALKTLKQHFVNHGIAYLWLASILFIRSMYH